MSPPRNGWDTHPYPDRPGPLGRPARQHGTAPGPGPIAGCPPSPTHTRRPDRPPRPGQPTPTAPEPGEEAEPRTITLGDDRITADQRTGSNISNSVSHSRPVASSRTPATNRANVITPGNNTRRSRNHTTDASNNAFGPSPVVHARASTHARNSACTSENSQYPNASRSSHTCSKRVFSRVPYSFDTDGSAIPNCPAR